MVQAKMESIVDSYIIDCKKAQGWDKFREHCQKIYSNSNIVSIVTVYDYQLAQQFGFDYPRVRVKTPRTYPHYLRFRNEAEYTAFALRWS
jgi:hypothetical protein